LVAGVPQFPRPDAAATAQIYNQTIVDLVSPKFGENSRRCSQSKVTMTGIMYVSQVFSVPTWHSAFLKPNSKLSKL
jgi:hypothetical protein